MKWNELHCVKLAPAEGFLVFWLCRMTIILAIFDCEFRLNKEIDLIKFVKNKGLMII